MNQYGGKASNLIKINASGITVPKTWVISNNYPLSIYERNKISYKDIDKILELFDNFPKQEYINLFCAVETFMSENKNIRRYAVRSSQAYEDGKKHSFSGLFFTELNLGNVANIVNSIIKCWKESYNAGVLEYAKNSKEFIPLPCSVIIQEFIPSDSAGVIFKWGTNIIIDSNYGLAKAIVDGETGNDEWKINSINKKIIDFSTNKTHCIIPILTRVNPKKNDIINYNSITDLNVCEFDNSSTTIKVELPEKYRRRESLTKEQIELLVNVCENISKELSIANYDIEWTYYNNQLYILQCRPLTREIEIIKNENESFGIGLVKGKAIGKAIKVYDDKTAREFQEGCILVTKRLTGSTILAANKASGCIIESKSPLSHSAIIAREIGIPVIGAVESEKIENEKIYYIDGETGEYKKTSETNKTTKQQMHEVYNDFIDKHQLFDYELKIKR